MQPKSRSSFGKDVGVLSAVLLLPAMLVLPGCGLFTPPEARAEMHRFDTVMAQSVEQGKRVATQIDELVKKQQAGKLGLRDAVEKLPTLVEEGKLAKENYAAASASLTALRKQYDVPWWKIALSGAGVVLTTLLGGGALSAVKTARVAKQGIGLLVGEIEASGNKYAVENQDPPPIARVKDKVKTVQNAAIEEALRKMKGLA